MGQVRPKRRLPKVSRFLTSKPGVQRRIGLRPRGGHPKIAWKLRRSSLHRGRPSLIFRGNFCPQALSSKFRMVRVRSSLQIKREDF
ncbi:hypothetical protein U9M48_036267 [Paspalum notatum var. saurae]|uniref:Uncharacterized protein n=1 Tax=Paspalum notatum var. saurae TaxID=547442 RepID=A0AAQ3XAY3_PASNO